MSTHCTTETMSEDQLKAFMEAVKVDAGLQEKLKAAGDDNAVVAIAKEAGFVISVEEVTARQELSDGELEEVAGGNQCGGAGGSYGATGPCGPSVRGRGPDGKCL